MILTCENTKGWSEKCWLGIGRSYDMCGDFEGVFIYFIIWKIGWWKEC